jgi:hypothetical protein
VTVDDLPSSLSPFAFLVGDWEGEGVGGAPGVDDFAFAQDLSFVRTADSTLGYTSRVTSIETGAHVASEAGYWRALDGNRVELVVSHSAGFVEVAYGTIAFTRIETASDLVARTAAGDVVATVRRLYGMVGEELMYAVDMAAEGVAPTPRFSARLRRTDGQAPRQ